MNVRILPPPNKLTLIPLLVLLFVLGASARQAAGQQMQSQPNATAQLSPVSLPHLYWHFLIHQSILDGAAAQVTAQGKNGNALRNDLQTKLGFSDADYAPIRTSSQRLASELKPINDQLKTLSHVAANAGQARSLIAQRETFVANEVDYLSYQLSPKNKTALENFMRQFFAPKPLAAQVAPGQSTGEAVTK